MKDSLYPISFDPRSPTPGVEEYVKDPTIQLLTEFFHRKGLAELKREDREEKWYQDWLDYQDTHGLYAAILSPKAYSTRGHQLNLLKLTRFLETFAYFSPGHAYSLHVSFLGLFPILLGSNEALKKEAIAKLEAGGLFAFAVSERKHGSDLLANEFVVRTGPLGRFADGAKSYIGNANVACMISVLARECNADQVATDKRTPFLFFSLRPENSPGFQHLEKLPTLGIRTAFVGEFEVHQHPVAEGDIISRHREAWAAMFGTVDFGKFFLGFGAIGICEHAFAEAMEHLQARILYFKLVWKMTHIRNAMTVAFGRLVAMKLYAYRALDYLQAANQNDRRYLLFNPVQKARVSTQGVKVLGAISECVGARGFETNTCIESALREALMIPGLEGSTHINFSLTAQFIERYFATSDVDSPKSPESVFLGEVNSDENPYWTMSHDRNPKTVRFGPFLSAYESFQEILNVQLFVQQVTLFARFAEGGLRAIDSTADPAKLIGIGKCFSTIAYGQLIAENCRVAGVTTQVVAVIFQGLVADLSVESFELAALFSSDSPQRANLELLVRVPTTIDADMQHVSDWITMRYPVQPTASTAH